MARLIGKLNDSISRHFVPVLTGAGASAAFGFPMMTQAVHLLSQHIRQLPESGSANGASRSGRLKHYKRWIEEEMTNLGTQVDLETFLIALDDHIGYLSRGQVHGLARRLLGDLGDRRPISNDALPPLEALKDLRLTYMEFVHSQYGKTLADQARVMAQELFHALAQDLHPMPYALFTTNYDTVADAVPALLGKERLDGFIRPYPEGPEVWSDEGFDEYAGPDEHMPVFHLHGSASWVEMNGEVRRYPGLGRLRDVGESVLIYPGQSPKEDGSAGHLRGPLKLAADYFAQAMALQRKLIAIGYSFRDAGVIREIDRAAAYAGSSIRLHVLAPDKGQDIDDLFQRANIRGEFIEARFEDTGDWVDRLSG